MASIFNQVAVRSQLTEHPEHAVYAAWTVFNLTVDALYYLFEDQIRALCQRCFDFQDHTLGIPPRLRFLSPSSLDQGVEMRLYQRLLWMLAAGLVLVWLVPQDRRHGKIPWSWSVPVTGDFPQWGMLCLRRRMLSGRRGGHATGPWVHILTFWATKWVYRRGQGISWLRPVD